MVTLPEDMSIRETTESVETLRKMGVALGPVIVNGLWREVDLRRLGREPAAALRADAGRAGIELSEEALARLGETALTHAKRARNQRNAIKELDDDPDLTVAQLPYLFTVTIGPEEIARLADALGTSGPL